MTDSPTFGIDLGTTCSAIGFVENGQPRLIEIDGDVLVPSVVYFPEDGQAVVGRAAENQLLVAPGRTLRSTKRRMGSAHCWQVGDQMVNAPAAATAILEALVRGAEAATGIKPERVVVTVPAWFPHDARADTRRAAEAAGLEVVRLINEPTAAALAHGHGNPRDRMALVYDFGGGTFDASLIRQSGALIEVLASNGDVELGGDDLDVRLVAHALGRLAEDDRALAEAVQLAPAAGARLRSAMRKAKHELSDALTTTARQPFLCDVDGKARHLELDLDREALEQELMPLIERTFACVDTVLKDADVKADTVDELLLVGGTTHAPLVWESMRTRYAWEGSAAVPAEHAVALGAAIQAAIVDGSFVEQTLLDVTPYGISVAAVDGDRESFSCEVITPRNAPLPSRHTKRFFTMSPIQTRLAIPVLQGTDANPLRNVPLGTISIGELLPAPVGAPGRPIGIEFRQDLSGLVSIVLTDELSGRTVDGQVVVGGEESEQARELLVKAIEEDGLLPGDGTDPDPYLEHEGGSRSADTVGAAGDPAGDPAQDAAVRSLATSGSTAESDEAQQAFQTLLGKRDDLVRDHPEHARVLLNIAADGLTALVENRVEDAVALYDELSDQLFDLGIYL